MKTYTTVNEFKGFPANYEFKWDGQNYVASRATMVSDDNGETQLTQIISYSPEYMSALEKQGYVTCGQEAAASKALDDDAVQANLANALKNIEERRLIDMKIALDTKEAKNALAKAATEFYYGIVFSPHWFTTETPNKSSVNDAYMILHESVSRKFRLQIIKTINKGIENANSSLDNLVGFVRFLLEPIVAESNASVEGRKIDFKNGSVSVRDSINNSIAYIMHELTLTLIERYINIVANIVEQAKANRDQNNCAGNNCGCTQAA
jgi:hypothetical protein